MQLTPRRNKETVLENKNTCISFVQNTPGEPNQINCTGPLILPPDIFESKTTNFWFLENNSTV